MKIRSVEVYKADIPLVAPFRIAIGETTVANNVLIKIHTDEGLYGVGEASPFTPIVGETQATDLAAAKEKTHWTLRIACGSFAATLRITPR